MPEICETYFNKLLRSLRKGMKRCLFVPKGSFHLSALFVPSFHPPQNPGRSGLTNAFTSPRSEEQHLGRVPSAGDSGTAGDVLRLLSRNEVQVSLTESSTLTPKLPSSSSCSSASTPDCYSSLPSFPPGPLSPHGYRTAGSIGLKCWAS